MQKAFIYFLLSIILVSCNSQSLDLSVIDFDKPSKSYPLQNLKTSRTEEQKGHFEVKHEKEGVSLELKDDGERVTNYIFMDESTTKQLNYSGLMVNPNIGVSLSVYDNKVVYIDLTVDFQSKFKLFDLLKSKLGKPAEIINNEVNLADIDLPMQKLFLEKLPNETKVDKENGYFSYPERLRWIKGDVFYKLELNPSGNSIESSLTIISKKALKDKIIAGYQHPENDLFLNKYLK
ncbi:MAG: hypothetical protein ABI793_00255 [Flavobacterium sp.]